MAADFSPAVLQEMAEGCHTHIPAEVVPSGPGIGTKITAVQLNQLFVELSGLVDKVTPFTAYVHLKRCIESLREAGGDA